MTSGRGLAVLLALGLAACGPYPRDVAGTLDRIEAGDRFRVGLAEMRAADRAAALAFVSRIERATGAGARIDTGPAEAQLARLESGRLDLVIGEFAEDTPWAAEAALIEPLSRRRVGERTLGLSPVAAHGENRWIALIEREVRGSVADKRAGEGE